MNKILACVAMALGVACDSSDEAPAPAQAAVETPVAAPEPAAERPAPDPGRLERARKRLLEGRELAEQYAAGTLGDRLAVGKLLLVDAKAPADTDQSQFFVFAGELATPANFAALAEMTGSDGKPARKHLQGGEDAARVAVYHNVEPGPYTVCVALSGPVDPAQLAFLKQAEAAFEADGGGKLSAEKIEAAAAKAKAETGYTPKQPDWSARPVRCKSVEVTADAASRVVVVE